MNVLGKSFSKGNDLVTRNIAGGTIIVPIRDGVGDLNCIYTLNELGTRIWHLIDGMTGVKGIIESVTEEYEVSEEEASKDVQEYLESLEKAGLIRSAPL